MLKRYILKGLSLFIFSIFINPVQVSAQTCVIDYNRPTIAAGDGHTVGLKEDGKVIAVGLNSSDQLKVSSWMKIKAAASGAQHTVGLREDGTVVTSWLLQWAATTSLA